MVFAINAVESGPNNFAAFLALAKQINGTAATTGASGAGSATASSPSATKPPSNGAVMGAPASYGAALGLGALAVVFAAL
jgi:hypothetical protein